MKFSMKDFFSTCDQIRSFLWIWSHLLNKSYMENFVQWKFVLKKKYFLIIEAKYYWSSLHLLYVVQGFVHRVVLTNELLFLILLLK